MRPQQVLVAAAIASALAAQDAAALPAPAATAVDFVRDVQPILRAHCIECHGPLKQKSGYRLDHKATALTGGDGHAPNIVPGNSSASPLLRFVAGLDAEVVMPPKGARLTVAEIAVLRRWIDDGAVWPDAASVQLTQPLGWWSLRPLQRPSVPPPRAGQPAFANALDAFVDARLAQSQLAMAPAADDRALCRRLFFDLTGLPPSPEEVDAYAADAAPDKYERLVDRLLASPRYGERWARHWLDVGHYADTHGYDKDQPRPNAWPYRDWVVRAMNDDVPYARFVELQLAGDVLAKDTRDGVEALGFLAAGPWDLIGHTEVAEDKIDGKFARHFDRDDMVGAAIGTFASATVQCAQCHDHKFDPFTQVDYYSLQAVFAAVDRADKVYDVDPALARQRAELQRAAAALAATTVALDAELAQRGGERLQAATQALADAERAAAKGERPEYGWHSAIEAKPDVAKWVQVDLGAALAIDRVVLHPAHDDFNHIGDGFGFPVRYRIEASDDATFASAVATIAARDDSDQPNPGITPQIFAAHGVRARYVRVAVTKLAPRQDDFIAALAELEVFAPGGDDRARGAAVTSSDSIEAPPRWGRVNLTDGIWPGAAVDAAAVQQARAQRDAVIASVLDADAQQRRRDHAAAVAANAQALTSLPPPQRVYAATVYTGSGAFRGTGADGGRPRPIHVLKRGQVTAPLQPVQPAALAVLAPQLPSQFALAADAPEGERRAALAHWLTDARNPLTWRSIVNRVWHWHFGRGLVDTPNDFGRMGGLPSHPELLDWLAVTFRDDLHGSLKALHRLIVTSAAYRQSADVDNAAAAAIDRDNVLLWRGHARKLEAEAVRDAMLAVAGTLDLTAGGPGWQDFVIEHPEHSPHYRYDLADPADRRTWRRAIWRFVVRSQLQPFLTALDCADPSVRVDKRNVCVSPAQALTLWNSGFVLTQSAQFAARVQREAGSDLGAQVERAFRLALCRSPADDERAALRAHVQQHGLASGCRVLFNLSEFSFAP